MVEKEEGTQVSSFGRENKMITKYQLAMLWIIICGVMYGVILYYHHEILDIIITTVLMVPVGELGASKITSSVCVGDKTQ